MCRGFKSLLRYQKPLISLRNLARRQTYPQSTPCRARLAKGNPTTKVRPAFVGLRQEKAPGRKRPGQSATAAGHTVALSAGARQCQPQRPRPISITWAATRPCRRTATASQCRASVCPLARDRPNRPSCLAAVGAAARRRPSTGYFRRGQIQIHADANNFGRICLRG